MITAKKIYPSIIVKPINNPEKIKVTVVAAYKKDFEEKFQPFLVSLRNKVTKPMIKQNSAKSIK
jgi:hypothetical protein